MLSWAIRFATAKLKAVAVIQFAHEEPDHISCALLSVELCSDQLPVGC